MYKSILVIDFDYVTFQTDAISPIIDKRLAIILNILKTHFSDSLTDNYVSNVTIHKQLSKRADLKSGGLQPFVVFQQTVLF